MDGSDPIEREAGTGGGAGDGRQVGRGDRRAGGGDAAVREPLEKPGDGFHPGAAAAARADAREAHGRAGRAGGAGDRRGAAGTDAGGRGYAAENRDGAAEDVGAAGVCQTRQGAHAGRAGKGRLSGRAGGSAAAAGVQGRETRDSSWQKQA